MATAFSTCSSLGSSTTSCSSAPSEDLSTGSEPPLKKKKCRSDVWEFFTLVKVGDATKAKCLLCLPADKCLSYHGGTSNLREHLLVQHRSDYKQEDKKQSTLFDFAKRSKCSVARSKEITNLITEMIYSDLRPLRLVEGKGFVNLLNFLEPGCKIPSAAHFSTLVRQKHQAAISKLKEVLQKEAKNVSLTTDIWTSIANDAYLTVSAHFISTDWTLYSVVLCTCAFPERHTGVEISHKLVGVTEEFSISDKIVCIVHDQGSNMVLCMRLLNEERNWDSLRCSAHCLQLCINSSLSSVSTVDTMIAQAKKLVAHFRHSVVASEALKARQTQMGVDEKKLIQSCSTRWNSSYEMMVRLLEMRWPISAVLSDDTVTKRSDRYLDLKSEYWALMEELVEILKPFQVATTFLQYEHNSSLSCIIPIIHGLDLNVQPQPEDSVAIRQVKAKIRQELRTRWKLDNLDVNSLDVIAPVLDPRFKQMKYLNSEQIASVKGEIKERLARLPTASTTNAQEETSQTTEVISATSALDILLGPEEKIGFSNLKSPQEEKPIA